jgi:uncharacterized membrane protein YuzA (DUF378 family)
MYPDTVDRVHTMHAIDWIAMILMIIGGINWGPMGMSNFDLVATRFDAHSGLTRLIYALVGLAALYGIYMVIRWGARSRDSRTT